MKTNSLTIKQEAFCQAFIRLGDKSAAYREAGYSFKNKTKKSANEAATRLSLTSNVAARIEELRAKFAVIAETKFNITAEEILRHLNILRNSRIDQYVEYKKGKLTFKDFDKITDEQLMCIESIKDTKNGIEIKLHGKDWTIEKINKHIGFYGADNKQKTDLIVSDVYSDKKEARLRELLKKASDLGL